MTKQPHIAWKARLVAVKGQAARTKLHEAAVNGVKASIVAKPGSVRKLALTIVKGRKVVWQSDEPASRWYGVKQAKRDLEQRLRCILFDRIIVQSGWSKAEAEREPVEVRSSEGREGRIHKLAFQHDTTFIDQLVTGLSSDKRYYAAVEEKGGTWSCFTATLREARAFITERVHD